MKRSTLPRREYRSLQDWMEGTKTSRRKLIALVKLQTGHVISESLMSMILTGSRRCSRINATVLHTVTRVPMETLLKWEPFTNSESYSADAKVG